MRKVFDLVAFLLLALVIGFGVVGWLNRKAPPVASASQDSEPWLKDPIVVARFIQIEGYRCLSLMRAVGVVKCQLALA
jgi:hypothetical protein